MAKATTESKHFLKLKCICENQGSTTDLEDIFPETLNFILSDGDLLERIQALEITFSNVLPKIPPENLNISLKEISSVAESLFDNCLTLVINNVNDSKQLTSALENTGLLVSRLISFVNFLVTSETPFFDHVIVLLSILQKSYHHCADCETIYKGALEHVKDFLQNFITQCHNLQSTVLVYLEQIEEKTNLFETCDTSVLTSLMDMLFNVLCPLGEILEIRSTIPVWRTYFKILSKYKNFLLGKLNVSSVVTYLCSKVSMTLEQIVVCTEKDSASKTIKLCSFLLKLIVSLCDKFNGYVESCSVSIVSMCLLLLKLSPPSLSVKCEQNTSEEIERTLFIGLEPLIDCLLNNEEFVRTVLLLVPENNDFLALSRFCIVILDLLPSNMSAEFSMWFPEKGPSILSLIFQTINLCTVECMLPVYLDGVMHRGKKQHSVSFFHFIAVHVCGFVSSLSPANFQTVERFLFKHLLSNRFLAAILAIDVLCFVARFATPELAYIHARYVARLLYFASKDESKLSVHILNLSTLLNRLYIFLSKTDQGKILSEFSETHVGDYLGEHSRLPGTNSFQDPFNSLQELNTNLRYLENLAKTTKMLGENEELFLLKLLEAVSTSTVPLVLTDHVLSRINKVVPFLSCFEKANILVELLQKCVTRGSDNAHLFLISWYQTWVRNTQTPMLVAVLSRCAAISLNARNIYIQEIAFERFADISHPVVNEHLIRQTLKMCSPGVMTKFKQYMKLYVSKTVISNEERRLELINQVIKESEAPVDEMQDDFAFELKDLVYSTSDAEREAPITKRAKCDESLNIVLCCLTEAVDKLESECFNCPLDGTSQKQVLGLVTRLKNLCS